MRLFCLPFAGGSAYYYIPWGKYLPSSITLSPIELTGRGTRYKESHYKTMDDAVEDVLSIISTEIQKGPYILFGHSMGSLIEFELYYKILTRNLPLPRHIFYSGSGAPHIVRHNEARYHTLPDDEFKKEVLKFGGTAKAFVEEPGLFDLFLPILKNDFKLVEEYKFTKKGRKMECDITVLWGKQDNIMPDQIEGWKIHTEGKCVFHPFDGGHFYLNNVADQITEIITDTVKQYC